MSWTGSLVIILARDSFTSLQSSVSACLLARKLMRHFTIVSLIFDSGSRVEYGETRCENHDSCKGVR